MPDLDRHALFTHLTAILLGLELLHGQRLAGRQRRMVEHALRSARALRALLARDAERERFWPAAGGVTTVEESAEGSAVGRAGRRQEER